MRNITAFLFFVTIFTASNAFAKEIRCDFDSYNMLRYSQSKQDEIVKSYLGEKVYLDSIKGIVQLGWSRGWSKPIKVSEKSKTSSFIAYIWFVTDADIKGKVLRRRYSVRVYNDGRALAHMSVLSGNYGVLQASGTCQ